MVLEKSVNVEVGEMSAEDMIEISELKYLGKYGIVKGEEVADPHGTLYVGDKAVISVVVKNFMTYFVDISLKIYDNGTLVPMSASFDEITIAYAPPPIARHISVPCTSVGRHVITAKIALA